MVFQLNKELYEANISKITVEREFYTDSLDLNLDEAITELESELGTMLDDLRRERSSVQIASNKIIDFMANLLVRTQSLRNKVLTCGDLSLDCIATHLQADPKLLSRMAQRHVKKQADEFIREAKNADVIWTAINDAFSLPRLKRQQI